MTQPQPERSARRDRRCTWLVVLAAAIPLLVFAGVAGWGPEQLEDELERDDWIIEPAALDDIFTDDPEGLWSAVLRRKGGQYELVARMPFDPSLN